MFAPQIYEKIPKCLPPTCHPIVIFSHISYPELMLKNPHTA